jgi:hypothetical protein
MTMVWVGVNGNVATMGRNCRYKNETTLVHILHGNNFGVKNYPVSYAAHCLVPAVRTEGK